MSAKVKLDLTPGTWEQAEAVVGKEFSHQVGADPVNQPMIRQQLEALEWDCPLFYDDEIARQAGFEGAIAPFAMYMTFAMPAYWSPGDPPIAHPVIPPFTFGEIPAPGTEMMATDMEVEFQTPMMRGDVIESTRKLAELTRKRTKLGDGAFLVFETTYTNQRGEVVALERMTVYRYEPGEEPPSND